MTFKVKVNQSEYDSDITKLFIDVCALCYLVTAIFSKMQSGELFPNCSGLIKIVYIQYL